MTGAAGFIGSHVSRHFNSQGKRVLGVGHGTLAEGEIRPAGLSGWYSGDVMRESLEAFSEPADLIVHCAGSSVVDQSFRDPEAEFRKNVGAVTEILEFALNQPSKPRVVVLSSAAVYGVVDRLPINEDAPLKPISPYGQSKCLLEETCQRYGRDYGIEIVIVRLFSVYGRGLRKQLFWEAVRKLSAGDGRFGGSGRERRDWLHVDDAVRLIEVAAKYASAAVPIVNGGSGTSIEVRDALAQLHKLLPPSTPDISFSGETRAGDPPGYEADIARALSFGWSPLQNFAEGLADYVVWARGVSA